MAVAQKLGIEYAYGDWRRLCDDSQIDAIAIATPPAIQPEIAMAALQAGKAVWCEKPLAVSLAPAQAMVRAAAAAKRANMVDFEFPEIPAWQETRLALSRGAVGRIRQAVVNWTVETYAVARGIASWKTRAAEGGGILFSFVSHVLYNIEFLLGPIHQLSCRLFATTAAGSGELGETFVTMSLLAGAEIPVSVAVSTASFLGSGHSIEINGDEGTLVLRNLSSDYIRGFRLFQGRRGSTQLEEIPSGVQNEGQPPGDGRVQAVSKLAGRFLDWVKFGRPACPDFRQGLRVQALLARVYESHQSGKWVRCDGGQQL